MSNPNFNANIFFQKEDLNLIYTEDCFDDFFMGNIDNNTFIFHQFTWNIESNLHNFPWNYESRFLERNSTFNFKKNFIFCAPTLNCHYFFKKNGYNSIFLNHNSLVDYQLFSTGIESEKKFDFVINSRPFNWKRVYLSISLSNLAYIKGNDWANNDTSWNKWNEMTLAEVFSCIPLNKVSDILSSSKIGLILSGNTGENQQGANEGANYSTIEYLFSGLPVVSTPNQGGRNFWLNENNCLFCDPNEESVSDIARLALEMKRNGIFHSERIRKEAIAKADNQRNEFVDFVQQLLTERNVYVDFKNHFFKVFYNRFTQYGITPENTIQKLNSVQQ
jgi:glycosyltransferase involved in cell wall biosynthesis